MQLHIHAGIKINHVSKRGNWIEMIPRSIENDMAVAFHKRIAALLSSSLSNSRAIGKYQNHFSWLRDFVGSVGKKSYYMVDWGPVCDIF